MAYALFFLVLLGVSGTRAGEPTLRITDIQPVSLTMGVNTISNFADDGRSAQVIMAWRDNGNAWGYHVFLVMLPTRQGGTDWNVVGLEPPATAGNQSFRDVIRDSPHAGEDGLRAVCLAHGRVEGRPTTLLLIAQREPPGESLLDPTRVTLEAYRLVRGSGIGTTTDYFRLVSTQLTKKKYRNAEVALADGFGIRQQPQSSDPAAPDRC